jgi:hypothetical protein
MTIKLLVMTTLLAVMSPVIGVGLAFLFSSN